MNKRKYVISGEKYPSRGNAPSYYSLIINASEDVALAKANSLAKDPRIKTVDFRTLESINGRWRPASCNKVKLFIELQMKLTA
jgi:hypothetical protein